MTYEQELEHKYLMKPNFFWSVLEKMDRTKKICSLRREECINKSRVYRYFDTFLGALAQIEGIEFFVAGSSETPFIDRRNVSPGILEQFGASVSARERSELADCVLTVKLPVAEEKDIRDDYNLPLPRGTDFYHVDPNDFGYWNPLQDMKSFLIGGIPLQEAVRLYVQTYRFELYPSSRRSLLKNRVAEIALDFVIAIAPSAQTYFCELEIERKEAGSLDNVNAISAFFLKEYGGHLKLSPEPKWIKAMKLLRGDTL